jgi:hypothetical protein
VRILDYVGWLIPLAVLICVALHVRSRLLVAVLALGCLYLLFATLFDAGQHSRVVVTKVPQGSSVRDVVWALRTFRDETSNDRWLAFGSGGALVLLVLVSLFSDRSNKK